MNHLLPLAAFAALSMLGGNARADASATGSLTQIGFQLIDLTPDDGLAPWVTFNPLAQGSYVSSEGRTRTPEGWAFDGRSGTDPFGAVATLSSPNAFASGSASIDGDLFAGSLSLQSAAAVRPAGRSLARGGGVIGGASQPDTMTFTLSPGAAFVLHAVGDWRVTTTAVAGESEYALSNLIIGLMGTTQVLDGTQLKVENADDTRSLHRDLEVTYANLAGTPTNVELFAMIVSDVQTLSLTSAVPEPGIAALWLAGLLAIVLAGARNAGRAGARPCA
jgi:hypothetical protein